MEMFRATKDVIDKEGVWMSMLFLASIGGVVTLVISVIGMAIYPFFLDPTYLISFFASLVAVFVVLVFVGVVAFEIIYRIMFHV